MAGGFSTNVRMTHATLRHDDTKCSNSTWCGMARCRTSVDYV